MQIAVSVPLVVGTVLFLKTAANLGAVDLGFDPRGLVTFQVNPGYTNLEETEYGDLYLRVVAGIEEIPGVRSVTIMENVLMSGIVSNGTLEVNGTRHNLFRNAIGPAFVETLGVELLAGRMPGLQDDRESPRIGVVNQTAVERIYGGSSPVGQLIGSPDNQVRIVGVVSDTPYRNRREAVPPTLFESALQRNGYGGHEIVVRSDVPPARLEPLIRQVVYQIDPDVPVPTIRSQTDIIAQSSARERVFTQLLTAFGIFALFLASIGLHGVTAYSVARRTSEIGLRVAVGARPGQILGSILRQVVILAAVGVAIGVPVALAAGPVIESLLFGVVASDPGTVLTAAGVMLAVATLAGLRPAIRAALLNPLDALRSD